MSYTAPDTAIPTSDDCHRAFHPGAVQAVTDYDMAAVGVGSYTSVNSATLTKEVGGTGQVIRAAYNGVNSPGVKQTVFTTGNFYAVEAIRVRSDGAVTYTVKLGGVAYFSSNSSDWKEIQLPLTAAGTDVQIDCDATSAGYFEVDVIDIPVASARAVPTIGSDYLLLGDGTTPTNMPVKVARDGYEWDVSNRVSKIADPGMSNQTFGVSLWFKPSVGCFSANRLVLDIDDGVNQYFSLYTQNNYRFLLYAGASTGIIAGGVGSLVENRWYHIYVAQDGLNFFFYQDGILVSSAAAVALTYSNQDVHVGYRYNNTAHQRAVISGVKLWKSNPPNVKAEIEEIFRDAQDERGRNNL